MTKQDILEYFKDINHAYNDCTKYDTLKRMIDELQEPCADAISRRAVLNTLDNMDNVLDEDRTVETYKMLLTECVNVLPSVTPAEKVGQWEWNQYDSNPKIGNFHCSQCHGIGKSYYDYCPYCGAKMQEVEE